MADDGKIFIAREDTLEEKIIPAQLLNDYKLHGEKSFVFHMPELWEKMMLHPYTANDIRVNGEALEYVLTIAIPGGKASLPNWLAMICELADAAGQGLFTGIETAQQLAQSETAMAAVANSETAMAAVANSKTSMTEIANSETAMAAVANSETAMAAVANSETAMAAAADSSIAMKAIAANSTAMTAAAASDVAKNAIANSRMVRKMTLEKNNNWQMCTITGKGIFVKVISYIAENNSVYSDTDIFVRVSSNVITLIAYQQSLKVQYVQNSTDNGVYYIPLN